MKTPHTPGPFPLHVQSNGERYTIVTAQGNHFATTHDPSAARLIAAAPELLAHLKMLILGISEGVTIPSDGAAVNAALEAIAKAEKARPWKVLFLLAGTGRKRGNPVVRTGDPCLKSLPQNKTHSPP